MNHWTLGLIFVGLWFIFVGVIIWFSRKYSKRQGVKK